MSAETRSRMRPPETGSLATSAPVLVVCHFLPIVRLSLSLLVLLPDLPKECLETFGSLDSAWAG